MIENNDTNDVAYLGAVLSETDEDAILLIDECSVYPYPLQKGRKYVKDSIAIFDCNGCRYGFRIKTLKTK